MIKTDLSSCLVIGTYCGTTDGFSHDVGAAVNTEKISNTNYKTNFNLLTYI